MAVGAGFLERQRELTQINEAVDRARAGSGSLLIVQGPAGIGKTELARAARGAALERGLRVLWGRGGELERGFPYGVVRQLLEPPLRGMRTAEREAVLSGAARLASPLLGVGPGRENARAPSRDPAPAILHGLYWLVSNLAESAPLLSCVDDAQWADVASVHFLHYLGRRIEELPVCLMLTVRRPEAGVGEAALAPLALEPAAIILRPAPLSREAVARLVGTAFDGGGDEEFCIALHAATGGTPFLVSELLRQVQVEGIAPAASEAAGIERLVPEGIARSVLVRLSRLPPSAGQLAAAVAVLGEGAELGLAAALAGLSPDEGAQGADVLVRAGILSPGRPLEFVHPILRQVVYLELPEGERALAHGQAARLLGERTALPAQVASHLISSDPAADDWVVGVLGRAAAEALAQGAPQAAVGYLQRALAEPPAAGARADLHVLLGRAQARAGDQEAIETLSKALELAASPPQRAEVALELARAAEQFWVLASALEALEQTAKEDLDPELALRIEAEWIGLARRGPLREAALARLEHLRPRAEPPRPASAVLLSNLALAAFEAVEPAEAVADLAEKALRGGWLLGEESIQFVYAATILVWIERFELAARVSEEAIAEGRRRGSWFLLASGLLNRAYLRYRLGEQADAEADFRVVIDMAPAVGAQEFLGVAVGFLSDLLMDRGDLEGAERLLEPVRPDRPGFLRAVFLDSRGRLRTLQARLEEAVADLRACGRDMEDRSNPGMLAWRSDLALALARLGERKEGMRLAEEEVELARAQGTPRAIGVALRALGVVEGGPGGLEHLREAAEVLRASPARLEHARALADVGAAVRRGRQPNAAREPLRRALDLAHGCGATALAERAREELLAAGARPRRIALTGVDALTASERRVAQLAVQGLSNREIAQSLFVSIRTVATHLTSTYRKLGIKRREQLPAALGSPPADEGDRPRHDSRP